VSAMTKEETLLSGNFERNQGRLPWPTSNGFISGHYGIQPHAVLKHVTTNNKGIYIQTPAGSSARAVFDGVVTQQFYIQGSKGVIIQHGNFRTVYANLTQVFVREGEHVSAKQAIGKIYTDDENDNKTELYFQIWNGRNMLNPESWIAR
jgi:murein hydrolase activator